MDSYEATKVVMSRVQSLDPENSSKIMGYILIQDLGEKEMIRLAFGPEILLLSHINQARAFLGLPSPRIYGSSSSRFNLFTNELLGMDDLIMSPSGRSDSFVLSEDVNTGPPFHRRSSSVNDTALLLSNLEPCVYFARGFCKNGTSCKFLHSSEAESVVGSPNGSISGFDEMLRMKAVHHQQRASFMASAAHNPFSYNDKFRSDFSQMGLVSGANSSARQIYLTFPAESTFKEEDVSNYFSMFGPVQDVRIPYQQKRMFGFVTFVCEETVKQILAKGNPHFICDSRVLVKPYREKGKILDKKQLFHQHMERGDYSACLSPTGIDSREHVDSPLGSRLPYGTREMMLRRKLEEVELQHAIELQGRRMMNLQLMDLKSQQHNHHFLPSLCPGVPISSPRTINHNFLTINKDSSEEFNGVQEASESPILEGTEFSTDNMFGHDKLLNGFGSDLPESLELVLPDNLFASPTKRAAEHKSSAFSRTSADDTIPVTISSSNNNDRSLPNNSPLSMKSFYIPIPRLSSGQEAVNM